MYYIKLFIYYQKYNTVILALTNDWRIRKNKKLESLYRKSCSMFYLVTKIVILIAIVELK